MQTPHYRPWLLLGLLVALPGGAALAAPVTVYVSGTLTQVSSTPSFQGPFSIGDTLTGSFTFDDATVPGADVVGWGALPDGRLTRYFDAIDSAQFTVGTQRFEAQPSNGSGGGGEVLLYDNEGSANVDGSWNVADKYASFIYAGNTSSPALNGATLQFFLTDTLLNASLSAAQAYEGPLATTSLTQPVPAFGSFANSTFSLIFPTGSGAGVASGTLTSFQTSPPSPVPLPAGVWLLGSAIASLVSLGRRRIS